MLEGAVANDKVKSNVKDRSGPVFWETIVQQIIFVNIGEDDSIHFNDIKDNIT